MSNNQNILVQLILTISLVLKSKYSASVLFYATNLPPTNFEINVHYALHDAP